MTEEPDRNPRVLQNVEPPGYRIDTISTFQNRPSAINGTKNDAKRVFSEPHDFANITFTNLAVVPYLGTTILSVLPKGPL